MPRRPADPLAGGDGPALPNSADLLTLPGFTPARTPAPTAPAGLTQTRALLAEITAPYLPQSATARRTPSAATGPAVDISAGGAMFDSRFVTPAPTGFGFSPAPAAQSPWSTPTLSPEGRVQPQEPLRPDAAMKPLPEDPWRNQLTP